MAQGHSRPTPSRWRVVRRVSVATLIVLAIAPALAHAQSARTRYDRALGQERHVRRLIEQAEDAGDRAAAVKAALRVTRSYEALVRRYPTSGYSDNALWQMAELHRTLAERFSRSDSVDEAREAYNWLVSEYPHSSLVRKARASIEALDRAAAEAREAEARAAEAREAEARAAAARAAATEAEISASSNVVTLTDIERTVLPETVRVTLFLDREVPYSEQRISGPERVFFDLRGVTVPASLRDATLAFADDVVREIRIGRHPNNTIRVVLDAEGVSRYSVFTLYHPFRVVIDCERQTGVRRAAATDAAAPPRTDAPTRAASDATPAAMVEAPGRTMVRNDPPVVVVPEAVPAARFDPAPSPPAPTVADDKPSARAEASGAAAPPPPVPSRSTAPTPTAPPAPPAANSAGGFSIARQLGLGVSRIVIDPGHGGRDPGNITKGLTEAEVTLDIALRLEKLLEKEPGIDVVLTRRSDEYVPLEERTAIANREDADLFLSIHANASRNRSARGIETYYLSFASSPDAEAVAARENTGSESAMHNLPDIIKAIALNNKLDESRDFASMVQESLVARLGRVSKGVRDRGVKKAPFVVLIGAGMPSVLAEVAFLSHREDARLMKTAAYRQRAAEALHAAVLRYRRSLKGTAKIAEP